MQLELIVEAGSEVGRQVVLTPGKRVVLGRAKDSDLRIPDPAASCKHVAVELTLEGPQVTDLESSKGTLLEGEPLTPGEPSLAASGAALTIGKHVIRLTMVEPDPEPAEPKGSPLTEDYERLRELGRGAAGLVFAARQRATGREVAVKVLLGAAGEEDEQERFVREAGVRVESPHVVEILEARVEGGQRFLVMELVEGGTAGELLADGPLPIDRALEVCEQAARGLEAAHAQGLIHRDIKPENILITSDGTAKISDFGIAKLLGAQGLTVTGQGMGTLAYVAPEQAEDAKRVEPAADLYSLGATLYHFLAGRPPFPPDDPNIIDLIFDAEPAPLGELRPDCPPELVRLVHRLLEKDPYDRLPNAGTLADALARLRG